MAKKRVAPSSRHYKRAEEILEPEMKFPSNATSLWKSRDTIARALPEIEKKQAEVKKIRERKRVRK